MTNGFANHAVIATIPDPNFDNMEQISEPEEDEEPRNK
jgi:hypothetical protein